MYYPKSQIKTNLYTNGGEYALISNNQEYTGYYWKTSSEKAFTGKTPNDINIIELKLINEIPPINNPTDDNVFYNINSTNVSYNSLKQVDSNKVLSIPTYSSPTPTPQDYQIGEFQRYFIKKANELIYTEVNKNTHDKIKNQNPTYLWQYYIAFSLPWDISGDKLHTAKTNKNIVDLIIQRLKLYKFNEYLQNDYLKFYK